MCIEGFEILFTDNIDGLPFKSLLPPKLNARLKTEKQWRELGFALKPGATGFKMHISMSRLKVIKYFLDNEVERVE